MGAYPWSRWSITTDYIGIPMDAMGIPMDSMSIPMDSMGIPIESMGTHIPTEFRDKLSICSKVSKFNDTQNANTFQSLDQTVRPCFVVAIGTSLLLVFQYF